MFEVARRMRTAQRGIEILGVLFFGLILASSAYGQEADDTTLLADDLEVSENSAFADAGQDLGEFKNTAEKSLKNEIFKDVAIADVASSTPTTVATAHAPMTPTSDDSLREIEREVDSLEAQSQRLSK
jgi:hypothetical protein